MPFDFTPQELELLSQIPEQGLIDLAVALEVVPDEVIDRPGLLHTITRRLLARARAEQGLPLSRYDAEDLDELPAAHRAALARAMGWPDDMATLIKRGEKLHKQYQARKSDSVVALWVSTFLAPVARLAHEGS